MCLIYNIDYIDNSILIYRVMRRITGYYRPSTCFELLTQQMNHFKSLAPGLVSINVSVADDAKRVLGPESWTSSAAGMLWAALPQTATAINWLQSHPWVVGAWSDNVLMLCWHRTSGFPDWPKQLLDSVDWPSFVWHVCHWTNISEQYSQ